MKVNKIVVGLLVVLAVVLVPHISSSKDNTGNTVVLTKDNLLVLDSEVDGGSVSAIISKAKELDNTLNASKGRLYSNNTAPLYLFLNSPGGSIQAGLELMEALHGIGRPVNTVTLFAASMAWQIAQGLDERLILKNGVLMSHRAAGGFEGYFGGTRPSQIDNRYQLWLDRVKELDEQTVARTNGKQTYDSYTKEYQNEMWLTGTKAVNEGYADRIVTIKCDVTLNGVTSKRVSYMGMDVTYDLDKCPINTSPQNIKFQSTDGKTINAELLNKIRTEFLTQFSNKEKQVLPTMF